MEQQNQQRIQEKAETKPPIKPNWKLFGVVTLVAVILSVGGILLFAYFKKSPGINPITYAQCNQLEQEIDTLIRQANYCEVDSDCIVSPEATHPGLCWNLVNKDADVVSIQEKKLQWENLDCGKGRVYEQCARAPQILKCQQNQCVGVWDRGDSAIDTSTWQTYRNEEFGFEFEFEFEYPSDMPFEIYSESSDNVLIGIGPWEAGRGGTNYASFVVNDVTQYRYRLEKLPKDLYEYSEMLISLGDFEPGVQIYFVNEGGELGMKLPYSIGDESEKLITTYYFYKKPYIFVFSLNFPLRGDLNKLYAKKIEKIVNTFRFIE